VKKICPFKNKPHYQSVKTKMWKNFTILTIILLSILWVLQIILFSVFYQSTKIQEMRSLGNSIKVSSINIKNEVELATYIERLSFKNGISIVVLNKDGAYLSSERVHHGMRLSRKEVEQVFLKLNNTDEAAFIYAEPNFKMNVISYAAKIYTANNTEYYLYMKSPIMAMDFTTRVLKSQFVIVTVMSFLIASILAYFMARQLAKPITKITKSAKLLGSGNYDIKFEGGNYSEINNLADTLNYAAKELKKTDTLRRDLLSNVSHDLKTPLTIIKSYAEMIKDLSGDNPQKRTEHLNVIINEADRLSYLVGDILDLSKLEANITSLNKKNFDLTKTVSSVLQNFSVLEENEGYSFITDFDKDCEIFADEAKIYQVVYNLINNALNYTGRDKKVKINVKKKEDKVLFEVIDTGDGIAKDDLDKVWDRYYKTGKNHQRGVNGTGIGLSIVKNILVLHNADFGVKSSEGGGSNFWFEL